MLGLKGGLEGAKSFHFSGEFLTELEMSSLSRQHFIFQTQMNFECLDLKHQMRKINSYISFVGGSYVPVQNLPSHADNFLLWLSCSEWLLCGYYGVLISLV